MKRFWNKATISDKASCWEWTSAHDGQGGYGRFWMDGTSRPAHRVAYELAVGPIPDGMQLDHLCRNRRCVNPSHLEPVTARENRRRAVAAMTPVSECPQGHPYDLTNTYVTPQGRRDCRACRRARNLTYYHRQRAMYTAGASR